MDVRALVAEVSAAKNYRHIDAATVERICREEASKHPKHKDAAKAAKRRLHQMTGAYCAAPPSGRGGAFVRAMADASGVESALAAMDALLAAHASTRERLPFAHELFADIRAHAGEMERIIDLACGVNPVLYVADCLRHGLPLPRRYAAYDIRADVLEQSRACFERFAVDGIAESCDLLAECPAVEADVALLFKAVPLLERQKKGCFERVIEQARAPFVAVTFPVRSLSGRSVGMAAQYRRLFRGYLEASGHELVLEKEYPAELLFLLIKHNSA